MKVYVLQAAGMSLAGVVGVYSSEALARAAAEEIWPQTDGYHAFEIVPFTIDKTYENVFSYGWGSRRSDPGPIRCETLDSATAKR